MGFTLITPTSSLSTEQITDLDKQHVWHPYSSFNSKVPVYPVKSAEGVYIKLHDGRTLIDGMSSWWSTLHGYNPPSISKAVAEQATSLSHVMFGGLTHEPAVRLCKNLVDLTPEGLNKVFLSDSGSVSVDIAMKMAIQYWVAKGLPHKNKMLALKKGYHGDTIGAMSVCDPVTGMHHLFSDTLIAQHFTEQPRCKLHQEWDDKYLIDLENKIVENKHELAALILEPIVQGTGGMYFYSPLYLKKAKELCEANNILLIADEIATGFGRTGKLFGCEHADITPDIMCLGKTLTGGTLTLAATLCTDELADTICSADPGVFMHGPTFMGNPLACTAANANIQLLLESDWKGNVNRLEKQLLDGLSPCAQFAGVREVRALGAIGVVELEKPVDMSIIQPMFVDHGIWIRPFGKLIYMMPAYIMTNQQVAELTHKVCEVVRKYLALPSG